MENKMKLNISKKSILSLEIEKSLSPIIEKYCNTKPYELKNANKIRIKILELCDLIDKNLQEIKKEYAAAI